MQRPHYRPHEDPTLPFDYVIARSDEVEHCLPTRGVAIPRHLLHVLNADVARRRAVAIEEAKARLKAECPPDLDQDVSELRILGGTRPSPAPSPTTAPAAAAGPTPSPFGTPKRPEHHVDPAPLDRGWRKPRGSDWIRIWDPAALRVRVDSNNAATGYNERDARQRDAAIFRKMLQDGPWRRCLRPTDSLTLIRALEDECPHMRAAIQIVHEHLALADAARLPLRLPPILLVGPPGVGKTHFATRLAELLGAPLRLTDFGSQQTNSLLHGSDRHWSNTKPGVLFDMLVLGNCANPVIVLDEIDKTAVGSTRYDPLAPLHLALEPSTARRTRDLSVEIEFDASHVIYIATANRLGSLPEPLLSRLTLILCEPPAPQDALRTALAVVRRVMTHGPGRSFRGMAREVVLELADHTPRDIVRLLTSALARAAAAGRRRVELRDLEDGETGPLLH